ncbi:MAG: response regulator [bacterium]|nr:MAG: response regulator [bacterium]
MKKRVLIIEDDKFINKAMKYKFEESNFLVKTVRTAEEGLVILNEWLPDVIILDILLPGIDGYEFLRRVKDDNKLANIPVIVASNLTESEDGTRGATDYIVKSDLDLDQLVKRAIKNIKK